MAQEPILVTDIELYLSTGEVVQLTLHPENGDTISESDEVFAVHFVPRKRPMDILTYVTSPLTPAEDITIYKKFVVRKHTRQREVEASSHEEKTALAQALRLNVSNPSSLN